MFRGQLVGTPTCRQHHTESLMASGSIAYYTYHYGKMRHRYGVKKCRWCAFCMMSASLFVIELVIVELEGSIRPRVDPPQKRSIRPNFWDDPPQVLGRSAPTPTGLSIR